MVPKSWIVAWSSSSFEEPPPRAAGEREGDEQTEDGVRDAHGDPFGDQQGSLRADQV
jgi:hypothetical protein